jgi:hypothetical protein
MVRTEADRLRSARYYLANRDRIIKRNREYRLAHKDRVNARCREWYVRNRIRCLERSRAYNHTHADEIRVYLKEYRKNNCEQIQDYHKRRYTQNREDYKVRASTYYHTHKSERKVWSSSYYLTHSVQVYNNVKNWRRNNPDRIHELRSAYRRRKCYAEGSHTYKEWLELRDSTLGICPACKQNGDVRRLTRDHIIPLSKGGSDFISNIQPLCLSCNSKKGTEEFYYL